MPLAKYCFLINPVAGRGKGLRFWEDLKKLLDAQQIEYSWKVSQAKGHMPELAADMALHGYRYLIGIGGDGTLHEIVNGVIQSGYDPSGFVFSLFPVGTGNDWVRTHRIPGQPREFLEMLMRNQQVEHSLGLLEATVEGQPIHRHIVNACSIGYAATVAALIANNRHLFWGSFCYLVFGLAGLFRYRYRQIRVQAQEWKMASTFITLQAGICRYAGGGILFTPHADFRSDSLAFTWIGPLSRLTVMLRTKNLYDGRIATIRGVTLFRSRVLEFSESQPMETDGEFLGWGAGRILISPHRIRCLVNESE